MSCSPPTPVPEPAPAPGAAPSDVPVPDIYAGNPIRRRGKRVDFYVTKARVNKYGETPGCFACEGSAPSHTDACMARIQALVKRDADKGGGTAAPALAAAEGVFPAPAKLVNTYTLRSTYRTSQHLITTKPD